MTNSSSFLNVLVEIKFTNIWRITSRML